MGSILAGEASTFDEHGKLKKNTTPVRVTFALGMRRIWPEKGGGQISRLDPWACCQSQVITATA
jgi:hypothetical protein